MPERLGYVYWLEEAQKVRALADRTRDEEVIRLLRQIAFEYEMIADRALVCLNEEIARALRYRKGDLAGC